MPLYSWISYSVITLYEQIAISGADSLGPLQFAIAINPSCVWFSTERPFSGTGVYYLHPSGWHYAHPANSIVNSAQPDVYFSQRPAL